MLAEARRRMIEEQLRARGVTDARLLAAFERVPRHAFVEKALWPQAYEDHPLPIPGGQTISQPYIVGLMTSCLRLRGHERVLEIGAGSGYQTAILAELARDVYAIERLPELARALPGVLRALGCRGAVRVRTGDGSLGWPSRAPFDGILVAAGGPAVPEPLLAQLADPGRLVVPVGSRDQQVLLDIEKSQGRLHEHRVASCMFVPLVGQHGWRDTDGDGAP
ncbi:MAG TPA: protein-L-isoaspartate(D-aspartate) O-methyltransferase [bacterium]